MIKLNNLGAPKGANRDRKRLGRGTGSGQGKTAGKGHKGQKARAGGGIPAWFEGGQMPLQRRVPKSGFKNINRVEFKAINLSTLEALAAKLDTERIDFQTLLTAGLVNKNALVKILGKGTLKRKLEVHAHAFSKSAQAAIEANQGTAVKL